jgi:pimeloyl-ACP methyl ester carboxylesterase
MKHVLVLWGLFYSGWLLAEQVDDQTFVDVGGTEVYVEVAGANEDAPLVLYLHGGPGNAALGIVGFQADVGRRLEQEFLVAYLHQRGAGKSPAVPDSEQTIANHVNDVDKVVEFLTDEYARAKVHLLGHSWGGMLAALYTEAHRDKVDKLVLV